MVCFRRAFAAPFPPRTADKYRLRSPNPGLLQRFLLAQVIISFVHAWVSFVLRSNFFALLRVSPLSLLAASPFAANIWVGKRPDAAEEILESLASEGVEPDARCYRLAAEAFRKSEDETSEASPEVERLSEIADRLESGDVVGEVAREYGEGGDGGRSGGGGGVDVGEVLDRLGVSGTAELQALLDGTGEVEFDSLEAC